MSTIIISLELLSAGRKAGDFLRLPLTSLHEPTASALINDMDL